MKIEQIISDAAAKAVKALYGVDAAPGTTNPQKTKKEFEGNLTLVVFPFLKASHKAPEATAQEIGEYLKEHEPAVASFNVIKGFLNLVIAPAFWSEMLHHIDEEAQFGIRQAAPDAPLIMVEYSSPNTNKPLHLGHVRNNLLGYSLSKILQANGNRVVKTNIVNDRGIHICKSMLAWEKWGNGITPEKAGKKVQIDISNGWYLAGFFLGNGCTLTLDENGNQICDFNSEKGLQAAEAIRAICNHPAYTSGDDAVLQGGMGDAICAGISGTWVAAALKERLGDNYAAAKLPTFTVDGEQVQMGSFLGCKIIGVNTQTQYPVEAMELAEYLTSEEAQIRRYEVRGYGPSNLNAAASEAVSADVALSALAAQSEFGVSQHVLGAFWTPAEAFGAELEAHSEADLQTLLDQFVSQVTAQ